MFKLMLVTDRRRSALPLTEVVRLALEGGVDAVQLRERDLEAAELLKLAGQIRELTRKAGAHFIVNHRTDLALAVEADGVHLGFRSVSVREAREVSGGRLKVGVSCHDGVQVRLAGEAGADYALLGPVFPTPSKEGLVPAVGVEGFKRCVARATLPLLGIGGITPENAAQVLAAGGCGVAVISAVMAAPDPCAAARALRAGA